MKSMNQFLKEGFLKRLKKNFTYGTYPLGFEHGVGPKHVRDNIRKMSDDDLTWTSNIKLKEKPSDRTPTGLQSRLVANEKKKREMRKKMET